MLLCSKSADEAQGWWGLLNYGINIILPETIGWPTPKDFEGADIILGSGPGTGLPTILRSPSFSPISRNRTRGPSTSSRSDL